MTVFTAISNALVAVGAKPFATTLQALRDNLAAAFEGDATAVAAGITLVDAALNTGVATAAGTTWVGLRTAGLAAGSVGSYMLASNQSVPVSNTAIGPGTNIAGSSLLAASAGGNSSGAALSGTWRSMGSHQTNSAANLPLSSDSRVTLFLRIS